MGIPGFDFIVRLCSGEYARGKDRERHPAQRIRDQDLATAKSLRSVGDYTLSLSLLSDALPIQGLECHEYSPKGKYTDGLITLASPSAGKPVCSLPLACNLLKTGRKIALRKCLSRCLTSETGLQ